MLSIYRIVELIKALVSWQTSIVQRYKIGSQTDNIKVMIF